MAVTHKIYMTMVSGDSGFEYYIPKQLVFHPSNRWFFCNKFRMTVANLNNLCVVNDENTFYLTSAINLKI
jgi:hypothetical protein